MKMIVVVALALVAAAAAAPPVDEVIPIVRSSSVQNPDGGYNFDFETGNGIKREETGVLKDALDEDNKPHQVVSVRGEYSFPGEDGKPVVIQYEADELGYRAVGDSIPTVPSRR